MGSEGCKNITVYQVVSVGWGKGGRLGGSSWRGEGNWVGGNGNDSWGGGVVEGDSLNIYYNFVS